MKDTIKSPSLDTGIDITKMHGHMDIYLTDVKTGEVEEVHEDNMMTNALQKYFQNAGFVNYPNLDRNSLVPTLLGGILAFDDTISEDADTIYAPAGLKMIANGSVGAVNNSAVLELGSYSSTESGWQNDGSYVQTYDYTTSQANGTIACVCLTSQMYGYMGEGNTISGVRHSNLIDSRILTGSFTNYTSNIPGIIFNISFTDSSCYSFNVESVTVGDEVIQKGFIRKYRLPITKINMKQTQTTPVLLSEISVSLSDDFLNSNRLWQPFNGKLLMWNTPNTGETWGTDFTQYLWTITPSGQITVETVVNTSGDSGLLGLCAAYFDGDYCFIPKTYQENRNAYMTSTKIYVWNRNNDDMSEIDNPAGYTMAFSFSGLINNVWQAGWDLARGGTNDGRIITLGGDNKLGFVVDAKLKQAWVHNAIAAGYGVVYSESGLFKRVRGTGAIYRDPTYIASINNLDNPVVKTAEKTMKVIYRITFDE